MTGEMAGAIPILPATVSPTPSMLAEWLDMRNAMVRIMSEHRALCTAPAPDAVALSRNRWLLSNAGRQRATWLVNIVTPAAERLAHRPSGAAWLAVRANMFAYRQRISRFVSRWPIEAVIGDWDGYRHDITGLRAEIAQWLRQEEFAIRALVKDMEAEQVPSPDIARQA
jgi:hypothetical protein